MALERRNDTRLLTLLGLLALVAGSGTILPLGIIPAIPPVQGVSCPETFWQDNCEEMSQSDLDSIKQFAENLNWDTSQECENLKSGMIASLNGADQWYWF